MTACKVHYTTNFRASLKDKVRVKDLETGKYYYVNSYKQKDSCINFTEYNRNGKQKVSKTICKYEIRN